MFVTVTTTFAIINLCLILYIYSFQFLSIIYSNIWLKGNFSFSVKLLDLGELVKARWKRKDRWGRKHWAVADSKRNKTKEKFSQKPQIRQLQIKIQEEPKPKEGINFWLFSWNLVIRFGFFLGFYLSYFQTYYFRDIQDCKRQLFLFLTRACK